MSSRAVTSQACVHVLADRDFGRLRCFQAGYWFELGPQGAVGQVFQLGGGRGGIQAGPGQDPAQVLDHIGAGPRALFLLRQSDRLLRGAGQLKLGGRARGVS